MFVIVIVVYAIASSCLFVVVVIIVVIVVSRRDASFRWEDTERITTYAAAEAGERVRGGP